MTVNDYRLKHSPALKEFLNTGAGKDLIEALHQLRPLFVTNSHPHVHVESAGAVRGYENCEKAIVYLSTAPKPSEELEMNYGADKQTTTT